MKIFVVIGLYFIAAARATLPGVPHYLNEHRVWNGQETTPHAAPYMIQLAQKSNDMEFHKCGAVLLNTRWVLTAAHCLFTPESTVVIAGQHNTQIVEPWEQRRTIARHYVHEEYCGAICAYDIGLIFVNQPFVFDEYIQPIMLPGFNQIPTGIGRLYGWGKITNTTINLLPDTLHETDKPIIDINLCRQLWGPLVDFTNLCTGPLDGSTAACKTDSGGPLIQFDVINGEPMVVGIFSWGATPCGRNNAPDVYVRVSGFIDWIYRTVGLID